MLEAWLLSRWAAGIAVKKEKQVEDVRRDCGGQDKVI
jgi:hypothetical protein